MGDNWALKASNLRKLIRNLEHYFQDGIQKTAEFPSIVDIPAIARHADLEAISTLFELVAAAAVTCDNRAEYVGYIMKMDSDRQAEMKLMIEAGMGYLDDYDAAQGEDYEEEEYGEKELVFGGSAESDIMSLNTDSHADTGLFDADNKSMEFLDTQRERDELKAALEEAQRELGALRNERNYGVEEVSQDNERLREMTLDLQERLERSENALSEAQEEAHKAKRQLAEAAAAAEEQREKAAQLADELDLVSAKAMQLHKAEATVMAYKKKLESAGMMNQQMKDMENQAEGYLRQIIDLEEANKQIPSLQRKILSQEEKIRNSENQLSQAMKNLEERTAELTKVKAELSAALHAKKMHEDELMELRAHQQAAGDIEDDTPNFALGGTNPAQLKEKIIRLEHANAALEKKLREAEQAQSTSAVPADMRAELEKRDLKIKQLSRDKLKLEQYSKNTLAKFQEKYLVALQECKKQLKEKHEEREALEMKASVEKTAHKREEQLLSSTIYELGVSILQNKLSSSTQR